FGQDDRCEGFVALLSVVRHDNALCTIMAPVHFQMHNLSRLNSLAYFLVPFRLHVVEDRGSTRKGLKLAVEHRSVPAQRSFDVSLQPAIVLPRTIPQRSVVVALDGTNCAF